MPASTSGAPASCTGTAHGASALLWLRGDNNFSNAAVTVSGNVTNDGTLKLESIDSSYNDSLTVGGTLTNSSTGAIQTNAGTGGRRSITGNIDNSGTITANTDISAGGSGTTLNQLAGSINAAGGRFTWQTGTMNFSGGGLTGPVYLSSGSVSVSSGPG